MQYHFNALNQTLADFDNDNRLALAALTRNTTTEIHRLDANILHEINRALGAEAILQNAIIAASKNLTSQIHVINATLSNQINFRTFEVINREKKRSIEVSDNLNLSIIAIGSYMKRINATLSSNIFFENPNPNEKAKGVPFEYY